MDIIEQKKCIFCNSNDLIQYFNKDFKIPKNISFSNKLNNERALVDFNVNQCNNCNTYQNKYFIDLNILYKNSHISPTGSLKNNTTKQFANIINDNKDINGIIEIGGGTGDLSDILVNYISNYKIIDPCYTGNKYKREIVNLYFEDIINFNSFNENTLIMSHVFEHFYNPINILKIIQNNKNIKYIYVCHPDFDSFVEDDSYAILTQEHIFFIENQFLINLFKNFNFDLIYTENIQRYSEIYYFKRNENLENIIDIPNIPKNINSIKNIDTFYKNIFIKINNIKNILKDNKKNVYIWPCSSHSFTLFYFGLDELLFKGFLDNSKLKIGTYPYGFNIPCYNFNEISNQTNENIIIFMCGGYANKNMNYNSTNNIEFIYL